MKIVQSTAADLEMIFSFYDLAVAYQKTKFEKHWLPFDPKMVSREIAEGLQFKIMEEDEVAAVFAITYSDPEIWGEKNNDPAIYIHRIVTHPRFRGRGYVKAIINWAKEHGRRQGKQFIRMDTWGDNQLLIDYYVHSGFRFLGTVTPEASDALPAHYSAIFLALFEIDISAESDQ